MPISPNQWGRGPWGGREPGAAPSATALDTLASFNDVWYRLGFLGANEIASTSWATEAELFQFADEAAKKIAYASGVFMLVDTSITVVAATAVYAEPASHVFTVAATIILAGGALQLLRPTPVRDLWALDATWSTTTGNATRSWWNFELPTGYVSNANISYTITSRSADATHYVTITPYVACVSTGAVDAITWGSALSTFNITSGATSGRTVTSGTLTPASCAAGQQASVKLIVNTNVGGQVMTSPFDLISVTFSVQGGM
jgi:hypothetical protein